MIMIMVIYDDYSKRDLTIKYGNNNYYEIVIPKAMSLGMSMNDVMGSPSSSSFFVWLLNSSKMYWHILRLIV